MELVLDFLDKTLGCVVAVWNGDLEEMDVANIIGRIQAEHRVLLGPGEIVEGNWHFKRCHACLDDVLVRVREDVLEICGGFHIGFAEGGIVPPISAPLSAISSDNGLSKYLQVIEAKTDAINNRIDRLQAYVVSDDIARDLAEGNKLKVKATL